MVKSIGRAQNSRFLQVSSRRRFLKYVAALGGAAGITALGYDYFSNRSQGVSTTSTTASYVPPANSTPDYSDFLKWLASVSKPYAGKSLKIALEYEFTPLAIQSLDLDFFNATGIVNSYDLLPYALHLYAINFMASTHASTYDVYSVDYQDVGSFKDNILSPDVLADRYPDLTYEKINSNDFYGVPWSYLATYPPELPTPYGAGG